ncbi:hypothetical protein KAS14_00285 [Candidatus Bathyarchaeota archaeon]|nr:hypothetical protein [Candidatus Bathyarchaeota archaeon]
MEIYYLIDSEATKKGIESRLYNPSTGRMKKIMDTRYRPYFFIPHPLSRDDEETVLGLGAKTRVVEKRNLFTGKMHKIILVEIEEFYNLKWISEKFKKAWEGEVPLILGYVYDHDLAFGAQHIIKGERIKKVSKISEEVRQKFEEKFSDVRREDPKKFVLLEKWFTLCSQPLPEMAPDSLGVAEIDPDRYFLAFMLSRLANLPVHRAYFSRQVSTWIRSILHNYLRRNNILIPTSDELRREETKRSVEGALTFPPEQGIYFNTVVTDFESLYPSLIDVYNLSYETIDCSHQECKSNRVPGLEHHVCKQRRGVYSVLIGSIKDLRIHWFKPLARDKSVSAEERRLAQATSQLLKLILVSSYGVTIRIRGLARPSLAESITAYGRYILQETWNIAKNGGLHPIYGDTDSLFLDNPTEDQISWLIKTVKERLRLDLAVDERYAMCVLPRAMKAYFGIRKDGTADIKGLTAIKSNSPVYIQNVFRDCVKEMSEVKNLADFEIAKERIQRIIRDAIKNLKTGEISLKDLEYSVKLHENPQDKREKTTIHQPYQCAIQLIDSKKPVRRGDTVNFVKVKPFTYRGRSFTVKPTEHVESFQDVKVEDYVRNLKTALNQTFKLINIQFMEEEKVTLSDFI